MFTHAFHRTDNKNTHCTHQPRRWNVTTSMVVLKKSHMRFKTSPKTVKLGNTAEEEEKQEFIILTLSGLLISGHTNGEAQRYSWGTQKKNGEAQRYSWGTQKKNGEAQRYSWGTQKNGEAQRYSWGTQKKNGEAQRYSWEHTRRRRKMVKPRDIAGERRRRMVKPRDIAEQHRKRRRMVNPRDITGEHRRRRKMVKPRDLPREHRRRRRKEGTNYPNPIRTLRLRSPTLWPVLLWRNCSQTISKTWNC